MSGVSPLEDVEEAQQQLQHQINRLRVYKTRRGVRLGFRV